MKNNVFKQKKKNLIAFRVFLESYLSKNESIPVQFDENFQEKNTKYSTDNISLNFSVPILNKVDEFSWVEK